MGADDFFSGSYELIPEIVLMADSWNRKIETINEQYDNCIRVQNAILTNENIRINSSSRLVHKGEGYIKKILKDYAKLKQKTRQLKFELSNIEKLSDEDIIDSLTFFKRLDIEIPFGPSVSDKTARVAIPYQNEKQILQTKDAEEISKQ